MDVVVTLSALNECAGEMFRQPHNQDRYVAPSPLHLPHFRDSSSRETSLSSEGDHSRSSRIQLTFNKGPRNIVRGYTFGRDPRICDVYLPKSSISNIHFSITFNEDGQLSLVDTSSHGTWVSYNGQRSVHPRHHFTWLLPSIDRIEVDIGIKDPIRFALLVPTKESRSTGYESSLTTYLESRTSADPSLTQLNLSSQETTRRPSRAPSPRRRPWYYQGRDLGRGTYGKVYKARDVTTCTWYAAKEFFGGGWQREIQIIKGLSHEHIVHYIDTFDEGKPRLIMELLPHGNLMGLQYLHAHGYAHRDIKPENILVRSRRPMHIKLADFGVSQDASALVTICGTSMYHAPELWAIATSSPVSQDRRKRRLGDRSKTYTTAVDIWALGVVMVRLVYNPADIDSGSYLLHEDAAKCGAIDPLACLWLLSVFAHVMFLFRSHKFHKLDEFIIECLWTCTDNGGPSAVSDDDFDPRKGHIAKLPTRFKTEPVIGHQLSEDELEQFLAVYVCHKRTMWALVAINCDMTWEKDVSRSPRTYFPSSASASIFMNTNPVLAYPWNHIPRAPPPIRRRDSGMYWNDVY